LIEVGESILVANEDEAGDQLVMIISTESEILAACLHTILPEDASELNVGIFWI